MRQARKKRSTWGLIIIVGTLFVLMLILVVVVGILVFARQFGAETDRLDSIIGKTSFSQLNVDEIDPALALASLGGVAQVEVIAEAIDKARPETAMSALLFDPALTNKESVGGFLQLAVAYLKNGNNRDTVFSYKMAGTIATLAPDLSDTVRADIFLQSGEGLMAVNEIEPAKFYLNQAFTIAERSPHLQGAHRRRIFERLQKNYIILEERALARESLSLGANPPNLSLPAQTAVMLPEGEVIPLPETIQVAEAERWRAAQELAILLVERGGKAPQEAIDQLAATLITEDQLRLPYYQQELATATQISKKIDVTLAQITWLSIKYRVARKGFGLSIVPNWETQAERIRADLTKTYEILYALYADLVIALPELSQIDRATEERLRTEVLAGEVGRYPNYPEEQRRAQLIDATEQLIKTQPEINIFVGIGEVENQKMYTLISLE